MIDQRVGAAFRAVRVRRGWRQADVAARAGASPSVVSLIERGHLTKVSVPVFRQVAQALDIRAEISLTLPHGELDRLLHAGHAALHETIARHLTSLPGWLHSPEVSFSIYRERGVIDILAFHEPTASLLVIELKTEFVSLEDLLMTMDVRMRHALRVARDRGWIAKTVSGWIVFSDSDLNRRRVAAHRSALRAAFPSNGHAMKAWLRKPVGTIRALSFWANSKMATANAVAATRRRVRVKGSPVPRSLTLTSR